MRGCRERSDLISTTMALPSAPDPSSLIKPLRDACYVDIDDLRRLPFLPKVGCATTRKRDIHDSDCVREMKDQLSMSTGKDFHGARVKVYYLPDAKSFMFMRHHKPNAKHVALVLFGDPRYVTFSKAKRLPVPTKEFYMQSGNIILLPPNALKYYMYCVKPVTGSARKRPRTSFIAVVSE